MDYKEFCAPFYNEEEKALSGLKGEKSQRKIGELSTMVSLTIPFNWPLIGGEMSAGSACGLSML